MNATNRSLIATVLALIVLGVVYVSMPNYHLKPQGIVLPIHGQHQPYLGKVQLYTVWNAPVGAENIGKLTVEYHSKYYNQQARMRAIKKAKQLAAKAGGNGLIYSVGKTIAQTPIAQAKLIIEGTVIRTKKEITQ